MKNIFSIALLMSIFSVSLMAQEHSETLHIDQNHKVDKYSEHDHAHTIRVAGLIGHTLIKTEGTNGYIFVPSWGFDIEYWFSKSWGVGFHNDLEIESFIIKEGHSEEIERVNPLVLTLDALYQFASGFVLSAGPGIELERGKSFYLFRLGLEYEKEIDKGIDICPAFFYDQRFDGYNTWTLAFGIGRRF